MFCSQCGNKILEGGRFCSHCGATLPLGAPDIPTPDNTSMMASRWSDEDNKVGKVIVRFLEFLGVAIFIIYGVAAYIGIYVGGD